MPVVKIAKGEEGDVTVMVKGRLKGRRTVRHEKAASKEEVKAAIKRLIDKWDADKGENPDS